MPTYSNAVALTSQATTVAGSLTFSYSNIATISGIPHKYQLEVERIFTENRAGNSAIVTSFLSDASVTVESKRDLFILPEKHPTTGTAIWTINETNKTITVAYNTNANANVNEVITKSTAAPQSVFNITVPNIIAGQIVTIRRKTISNVPLVTWSPGNQLTSNQLNLETTQLLYILQELLDRVYRQISVSGDIVSQIADNSVTTSKIVDGNVTTDKIANDAVDRNKIKDLEVINSKLGALSVTNDKIANSTIMAGKLSSSSQAWTLVGTLALTDLATSATGDKVTNKNYVIDRVSKLGIITKDSSNITTTQPLIGTTTTSEANDNVSLQSGGLWFNPIDGGLRVKVLDKWVRITGTPLTINDYISTGATAQTKTGNLTLDGNLLVNGRGIFTSAGPSVTTGAIILKEDTSSNPAFIQWTDNARTTNRGNIVVDSSSNMLFIGSTSETMRINSSGNVGIGTSTIYAKLEIDEGSSADAYPGIRLKTPGGGTDIHAALATGNYNPLVQANDRGIIYKGTDADVGTGSFVIAPWSTTASGLKLDSYGNVGIGVLPTVKLDVLGNAGVVAALRTGTVSQAMGYIGSGNNIAYTGTLSNHPLGLITANTQQATIGTNGSFSINAGYGSVAPIFGCRAWVNFDGRAASVTTSFPGGLTATATRVSGTTLVTVTTSGPHGMLTGHLISTSNAVVDAGGQNYDVTYASPTTFTFSTPGITSAVTNASILFRWCLIRGNGNVHSVTYVANANWNVNYATAMPDTNYLTIPVMNDSSNDSTFRGANLASFNLIKDVGCRMFGKAVNSNNQAFEEHPYAGMVVFR
jgi:hypothetical protein